MKLDNSIEIFKYLAKSERSGKSVLTISRELKLSPGEVRNCLPNLKESFVRVGNTERFTVNNFKTTTLETLIQEHRKFVKEDKNNSIISWALIAISLFSSVTAILASGS